MTFTAFTSAEDLANAALDRIRWPEQIGDLYEGTRAARVGARIYDQTRDDLLRSSDWSFARRDTVLTLLKSAPPGGYGYGVVWSSQYPPPPWWYEYAYPSDCLKVRAIRVTPLLIPSFDPLPVLFTDDNDASLTPAARVILTNQARALAVYTGQITDMTTWPADFTEAMIEALARRFAEALTGEANQLQNHEAIEQGTEQVAARRRG